MGLARVRHMMAVHNISARSWNDVIRCKGEITTENVKCPQKCKKILFLLDAIVTKRDTKELNAGFVGLSFDETHSQSEQTLPIIATTVKFVPVMRILQNFCLFLELQMVSKNLVHYRNLKSLVMFCVSLANTESIFKLVRKSLEKYSVTFSQLSMITADAGSAGVAAIEKV